MPCRLRRAQATRRPAATEPQTGQGAQLAASGTAAADAEAAQAAERRAEIADLTRQVIVGAVLTAPVLFAVMASDVFKVGWVPGVLLNHWVQLALITPVMFYTGWPVHRTGWLALSHRSPSDPARPWPTPPGRVSVNSRQPRRTAAETSGTASPRRDC